MSFTCFQDLPPELRLKIWEHALPGPRVVDINLSISSDRITTAPPPILLSVCFESRILTLQHYRPAFSTSSHPTRTYISPKLDTILLLPPCPASCYQLPNCFECFHFDYHSRLSRYDATSAKSVRNVAVYDFGLEGLASVWKFFPGMKMLSVGIIEHWTALLEKRERVKRIVEELLEKAREDVEELMGLEEVVVRVMSAEEMRIRREDEDQNQEGVDEW